MINIYYNNASTPWLAHKLRSFVNENLVQSNASYQHKPNENQRERVHTLGGNKGRGSNAPSHKGRGSSNAPAGCLDWAEEMNESEATAEGDGDNTLPTRGGRGGTLKRRRSQSKSTEEQVPVKRGARGGQGSQPKAGSSNQGTGDNPRDCADKSQVWKCPLEECHGHINWNCSSKCKRTKLSMQIFLFFVTFTFFLKLSSTFFQSEYCNFGPKSHFKTALEI